MIYLSFFEAFDSPTITRDLNHFLKNIKDNSYYIRSEGDFNDLEKYPSIPIDPLDLEKLSGLANSYGFNFNYTSSGYLKMIKHYGTHHSDVFRAGEGKCNCFYCAEGYVNISVYGSPDEWYFVNINHNYFKCDQFEGLWQLLADVIQISIPERIEQIPIDESFDSLDKTQRILNFLNQFSDNDYYMRTTSDDFEDILKYPTLEFDNQDFQKIQELVQSHQLTATYLHDNKAVEIEFDRYSGTVSIFTVPDEWYLVLSSISRSIICDQIEGLLHFLSDLIAC